MAYGNADKYFRQSVYDLFVNDDWRIRPELTINTGVRWDYGAPITELKGRLVNLDIAPDFTAAAPVLGSDPTGSVTRKTYPSSLVRPDRRKFEPRLGLAWRPLPTVPLVIRGGYGIYVDTSVYLASAQYMSQQSPLSKSVNVSNSATCPLTLANGFRECVGYDPKHFCDRSELSSRLRTELAPLCAAGPSLVFSAYRCISWSQRHPRPAGAFARYIRARLGHILRIMPSRLRLSHIEWQLDPSCWRSAASP